MNKDDLKQQIFETKISIQCAGNKKEEDEYRKKLEKLINKKQETRNGDGSGEYGSYELMQFTGLKDKNGKEIYEGDIARCLKEDGEIGEVKFGEYEDYGTGKESIGWHIVAEEGEFALTDFMSEVLTIIGNIHDNPELLESEE